MNPDTERLQLRIGSPADILAAVPYLLGFHPDRSLVVIGARPPRDRVHVTFRYDLPDPPGSAAGEIAGHAAAVFAREHVTMAIVAGYGPGSLVTPVAVELRTRLAGAGIEVREMLRAEDGRYWSYLCHDPACCPPEGVPYDVPSSTVAAEMTVAGNVTLPGRAALEAAVAPLGGPARTAMRQATARAENRVRTLVADAAEAGGNRRQLLRPVIDDGLRAVSEAIGTYRSGGRISSDDAIAWLTITLADLRVRDDAWARMDPAHTAAHRRLWTDLVRRAQPGYVAAPASLLAFTAWQSGDGALANIALDRAIADTPGYSMALLLRDAIAGGAPPSMAILPMTPEEVAAIYGDLARDQPTESSGTGPASPMPDTASES